METLIRRRVLRRLILVCTVCQLPFYGSPDYNGLSSFLGRSYGSMSYCRNKDNDAPMATIVASGAKNDQTKWNLILKPDLKRPGLDFKIKIRNIRVLTLESCITLSGPKRPGFDITIQNCIWDQRIDKQVITVRNESISLCYDVVVVFGAIVYYRRKEKWKMLPLVSRFLHYNFWCICFAPKCNNCSHWYMYIFDFGAATCPAKSIPADTQRWNNVDSTLIQRQEAESMLNRLCFKVVCLLECYLPLRRWR